MRTGSVRRARCVALVLLVLLSGCGGDLPFETATVRGTVSCAGRRLDHGEVIFVPVSSTPGPQAVGIIQPDGSFEMYSGATRGVAVGKHRVTVHCRGKLPAGQELSLAIPPSLIPEKYSRGDTTPLSYVVEKGGEHEYDIALD